jgi:hypothetical protein
MKNNVGRILNIGLKPIENILNIPTKGLVPDRVDTFFSHPTIFTWIVIFQALFGGNGMVYTPTFIKKLSGNNWFRLGFIVLIGYSATGDFETSLGASCLLLLFFHFMKTPEEREKYPNIF